MLVLSRKMGERIHIGEDIFVEVRRVAGNRVTLAVCAPKNVRILRGELFEAVATGSSLDIDAGGVLDDDAVSSESSIDTVIMRDSQAQEMESMLVAAKNGELNLDHADMVPAAK
jgi:carbon storage regulator